MGKVLKTISMIAAIGALVVATGGLALFGTTAGITLLGDTAYKGSLNVKSQKSNVTLAVAIQKQVGTSWSG